MYKIISPIKFVYNLNELFEKISLKQEAYETPQFEYEMTQGNYKITVNHNYNFNGSDLYINNIRLDYIPISNVFDEESIEDNGGGRTNIEHIIHTNIYLSNNNNNNTNFFIKTIKHEKKKIIKFNLYNIRN